MRRLRRLLWRKYGVRAEWLWLTFEQAWILLRDTWEWAWRTYQHAVLRRLIR